MNPYLLEFENQAEDIINQLHSSIKLGLSRENSARKAIDQIEYKANQLK